MGKENEIQVLNIDRAEVTKKLKTLKATPAGTHKFKRIEFLLKGKVKGGHSWGRVRTDGKETTITLKETKATGRFTAMNEYEIKVNDFKEAVRIVTKAVNPKLLLYFENQREAYRLGNAYVTIDKWPSIPSFMEIEAPSMNDVKKAYKALGIKGKFVGNAPIHKIYASYGLDFKKEMGKNSNQLKKLMER